MLVGIYRVDFVLIESFQYLHWFRWEKRFVDTALFCLLTNNLSKGYIFR